LKKIVDPKVYCNLKRFKEKSIFAEVNKSLPELAAFKSVLGEKNTTILKLLAVDSVNPLIV